MKDTARQDFETSRAGEGADAPDGLPAWTGYAILAAVVAGMFVLRLLAPSNLLDQDQERPAAYVLDAVKNANWVVQRDIYTDVASKPPLYTWLCAGLTVLFGRINEFALYFPCALSWLGVACLCYAAARKYFSQRAALLSGFALLLTSAGFKGVALARTDSLFTLTVTVTALLAFRAWRLGRGWTWFWFAAAAATLTKGPLGVVLGAGGLLGVAWERRTRHTGLKEPDTDCSRSPGERDGVRETGNHAVESTHQPMWLSQLPGVGLFLLLCGGWFFLAWSQLGQAFIDKVLGKELVGQAVADQGHLPGTLFYQQPLYYLSRAAPWSLLACYGLWRTWRRPSANGGTRLFERFLFCWFLVGLFLLSMAPHQRADLLWPLMPAGALLAGRELDGLAQRFRPGLFWAGVGTVCALIAGGFTYYYLGPHTRQPAIRQTIALQELAREIERLGGQEFPLTHADTPMGLQVYLNTLRPLAWYPTAAYLLDGPDPAYVAVTDYAKLRAARKPGSRPWFTALGERGDTRIISNVQGAFATPADFAFNFGPLYVRAKSVILLRATEKEFSFMATEAPGRVVVTNQSPGPRNVCVSILAGNHVRRDIRTLGADETWEVVSGVKEP